MNENLDSYIAREVLGAEPKANILLVDDQPANLLALRAILDDLGQNVVEAHSGDDALRQLLKDDFAVVILDVQMPGLDGFETAKLIRGRKNSRHTPIIFLTAFESDDFQVERAYSLGAVDYLVKPVIPVILRAKVAGFVELLKKSQQIQRQAEQIRQMERSGFERRLAEENARLQDSERFHRAIAELTTDYAFAGNILPDGSVMIHTVTEGFLKFYDYTLEEMNARGGWGSVIHPDDHPVVGRTIERLLAGESATGEVRGVTKSNQIKWQTYLCLPTQDTETGRVLGLFGAAKDITAQREAEDTRRELTERLQDQAETLSAILSASVDHIYLIDRDGRFRYASVGGARVLGFEPSEMTGKNWRELGLPSDVIETFDIQLEQAFVTGDPQRCEASFRIPSGAMRHYEYTVAPLRSGDGDFDAVVVVSRDDTDRSHMEEALRDADRRKDEFLATLAHELRNPLAPISNALEILKMSALDNAAVECARDTMERQLHHLVRLVDDLLDVSRVMRGKIALRIERVDLASMVTRAVEIARASIDHHGHSLTITLPPKSLLLEADPVRLTQIIANLLTNAAKYTEANGHIWLTVESNGSKAVLRIRDNGIGIAAEMRDRIFELFVQADHATNRSQGGLGIGLTLVKSLVEMHQGTIEAHSDGLGRGSEFVVHFPLVAQEKENESHEISEVRQVRSRPGHRLVVVDDNRDAAESLAMLLRLQGNEVRVAYDGRAALTLVNDFRPGLVFLDIGMPEMDGYEVARRLREQPELKTLVLVALTGWGQEEDRRRSSEAGFNHHLIKPASRETLEDLLAGLELRKR
jgi:PAS domain S-box-containing protein